MKSKYLSSVAYSLNFADNTDKFGVLEEIDIENTKNNEFRVNMISISENKAGEGHINPHLANFDGDV